MQFVTIQELKWLKSALGHKWRVTLDTRQIHPDKPVVFIVLKSRQSFTYIAPCQLAEEPQTTSVKAYEARNLGLLKCTMMVVLVKLGITHSLSPHSFSELDSQAVLFYTSSTQEGCVISHNE